MKLYIVRHGESEMNLEGRLAGHLPTPLSPLGVTQAKCLGARLKKEKFDILYSSDLLRARQTTAEILNEVSVPVIYDERLRERTWGDFDNILVDDFIKIVKDSGEEYHLYKPPAGESLEEVVNRAEAFLAFLLSKHLGQTVLLSAHHSLNKAIIKILLQMSWEEWPGIKQNNTCVNKFTFHSPSQVDMEFLNCTAHLQD